MPTITPFLWFDHDLSEALEFYAGVFGDLGVKVLQGSLGGAGLLVARFTVLGQTFEAMQAGPGHPHTDAFSIYLRVNGQDEVDRYWNALTEGGTEVACGWLTDRFGISWQIVPVELEAALSDPDPEKAKFALDAMMTQKKIVISELVR